MQAEEDEQLQDKRNGGNYRAFLPDSHFIWAGASAAQFGWALMLYRKGVAAEHSMPSRAFAVASLFVGGGATAAVSALRASGIHKVEDLMQLGANIRTSLGVRGRARDE